MRPPEGDEDDRPGVDARRGGAASRGGNPNIRFGLPSLPSRDPYKARESLLIDRPQYVLSYNAGTRTANWVCWRLRKQDIGNAPRVAFEPDPMLPKGVIARVTSDDYDNSGFDRGHICPAKDRSATPADSRAVFYMTNIIPQSPASNQRAWEKLEDYCRRLVKEGEVLFIAAGPQGQGGEGKRGWRKQIGPERRRITVPHSLWKVVLVLPHANAEPRKNSRVISVIMPNDQTVGQDWTEYRTSAAKVEKLTGYRFFRGVEAETARALREHVDDVEVHRGAEPGKHPRRRTHRRPRGAGAPGGAP
jgi:endonuclease G